MSDRDRTTWRKEITEALKAHGETWEEVERIVFGHTSDERWGMRHEDDATPPADDVEAVLDHEFDAGHGGTEGRSFTAWTAKRVYFPWCYDGAEGCDSVPRHPCDEATDHVGGG